MTDEEKAEECLHCNDRICRAGYLIKTKCKTCTRKQDFLDGLAEGRKENEELKKELEKEQNLNKVIKERLVEVNCDCNAEKKEKCVMFPEYCEGERKTVVDLMTLVSDGLNESLIKQKDEQIEVKKLEILELKAQNEKMKNLIFENIDYCFYCPLTDTCRNDAGICLYANITEEEQKNLLSEWITK